MSPSGWSSLFGMGRRSEVGVWAMVIVVLGLTMFGAVAGPRALRDAEADSLDQAIADAGTSARQLTIDVIDDYPRGFDTDPLQQQRERLEGVAEGIDEAVTSRFGLPRLVVDTNRFLVTAEAVEPGADPDDAIAPALPTGLTFRVHPEIEEYGELVAGPHSPHPTPLEKGALQ